MSTEKDIHLDEDLCFATKDKFAVISFCSSKSRQRIENEDAVALKIRGCFGKTDEAMAHVKLLKNDLDSYVMEMYKWTLLGNLEPGMDTEDHLVDMIKCHKQKNLDAREEFKKRKEIVKKDGLEAYKDDEIVDVTGEEVKDTPLHEITPISADTVEANGTIQISMADVDPIKSGDLQFAVISFVERDPDNQKLSTPRGCVGVKIRGAFATKKECEDHIEKLAKLDSDFDMYIVDLYKFLLLPPPSTGKIETRYREEYLHELFSTYEKSQEEAKAHIRQREAAGLAQELETPVHPTELKAIEESDGAGPSGS
jgi:hypothetical protein